MAFIQEFTVRGLAGREKTIRRRLDRHVNVFWGLNGTGKTSLLKILHSALRNDVAPLKDVPFASAEVVFFSTDHSAQVKRSITWQEEGAEPDDDDEYDVEFTVQVQADGTVREVPVRASAREWDTQILMGKIAHGRLDIPYRHAYLPISRMSQVSRRGMQMRGDVVDDAFLDNQFADQVQDRWRFYNSEANSRIRVIQQQGLASILAHLFGGGLGLGEVKMQPRVVSPDAAFDLVSRFLRQQRISLRFGRDEFLRRYEGDTDLQLVVANIEAVDQEVREALQPQEEFQRVIERLYSGKKTLSFDTHRSVQGRLSVSAGGKPIPLRSLSSGEKQLLRLMLEALAAEAGTVMIDEPELSMHVDWQQVLVESMRRVNPESQLLFATHSPEIMADLPDEVVFEL